MQDELNNLHQQVLATFGQPVTLIQQDGSLLNTTGIFSRELIATGHYDGVLQEITVISLDSDIELKRGSQVESGTGRWTVDRKLKEEGHLTNWNLHENRD